MRIKESRIAAVGTGDVVKESGTSETGCEEPEQFPGTRKEAGPGHKAAFHPGCRRPAEPERSHERTSDKARHGPEPVPTTRRSPTDNTIPAKHPWRF